MSTMSPTGVNDVAIRLDEYSIAIPSTLPAGPTRLTATNVGKEEHHMTLVRLADGQTFESLIAALTKDPAEAISEFELVPGPQSVAPGGTQAVQLDLQPGHYVALCVIPDSTGTPHAAKGMIAQFEVTGTMPAGGSAVPTEQGFRLEEYKVLAPAKVPLHGVVRVENIGSITHELALYRLAAGQAYDDAVAALLASGGSLALIPSGGVTAISVKQAAGLVLDLTPGTYVMVCFLPTLQHSDHLHQGMYARLDVAADGTVTATPGTAMAG